MLEYFFVLGEHPALSLAEISAWLKTSRISFAVTWQIKNILIVKTTAALDADFLIKQLGGTIKIGVIAKELADKPDEEISEFILAKTSGSGKTLFGLSLYGEPAKIKLLGLGLQIKKRLIRAGRKVRLVTSRQPQLSSVVVQTNKLLTDNGLELVIICWPGRCLLGRTLVVQPFADLSRRDYGRPGRDARSGMLPPKLAKILINLAEIDAEQVLLDPFCGSGTILTEAWLMGYQDILGSDNSAQAIRDTQRNIKWLSTQKNFQFPISNIQLKVCDARRLTECWGEKCVEAIVSEPWLGPPLTGREPPAKIKNIINELGQLYLSAFNQFKKALKKDGRVVFILPAFKKNAHWETLPILEQIASLGFKLVGEPLFYSRPDQKVGRQIIKFSSI